MRLRRREMATRENNDEPSCEINYKRDSSDNRSGCNGI